MGGQWTMDIGHADLVVASSWRILQCPGGGDMVAGVCSALEMGTPGENRAAVRELMRCGNRRKVHDVIQIFVVASPCRGSPIWLSRCRLSRSKKFVPALFCIPPWPDSATKIVFFNAFLHL